MISLSTQNTDHLILLQQGSWTNTLTELVAPFGRMGTSAFAFKLQEPSQLYDLLLISFCLTIEEEFAQRIWKLTCLTLWSKIDRISPQGCGIQRKWISRGVRALRP
jgi:hypothetical protein